MIVSDENISVSCRNVWYVKMAAVGMGVELDLVWKMSESCRNHFDDCHKKVRDGHTLLGSRIRGCSICFGLYWHFCSKT